MLHVHLIPMLLWYYMFVRRVSIPYYPQPPLLRVCFHPPVEEAYGPRVCAAHVESRPLHPHLLHLGIYTPPRNSYEVPVGLPNHFLFYSSTRYE